MTGSSEQTMTESLSDYGLDAYKGKVMQSDAGKLVLQDRLEVTGIQTNTAHVTRQQIAIDKHTLFVQSDIGEEEYRFEFFGDSVWRTGSNIISYVGEYGSSTIAAGVGNLDTGEIAFSGRAHNLVPRSAQALILFGAGGLFIIATLIYIFNVRAKDLPGGAFWLFFLMVVIGMIVGWFIDISQRNQQIFRIMKRHFDKALKANSNTSPQNS